MFSAGYIPLVGQNVALCGNGLTKVEVTPVNIINDAIQCLSRCVYDKNIGVNSTAIVGNYSYDKKISN